MTVERRAGGELRFQGRMLTGTVLRYGDISPEHRERFVPGSLSPLPDVPMRLQHDPAMQILPPGAFQLTDTEAALEVRAELPPNSAALSLVKRGAMGGWSIGFQAVNESRESDIRILKQAQLLEISLVDQPSYPASTAEIRRRGSRGGRLASFRGRIPAGKRLECRCGPRDCREALFESGALDDVTSGDRQRDLLAVVGDYSNAIGSKDRKSLRFWSDGDGGLHYAIDIPNNARGTAFMETADQVPVFGRPVLDTDASDFVREGTLAKYSRASVRAITIGPTDAAQGWEPLTVLKAGDEGFEVRGAERSHFDSSAPARRPKLWL